MKSLLVVRSTAKILFKNDISLVVTPYQINTVHMDVQQSSMPHTTYLKFMTTSIFESIKSGVAMLNFTSYDSTQFQVSG